MLCQLTNLPVDKMVTIFEEDIFRCIFVNEKFCILIKISPKSVPKGPNNNNPVLVKIMACHRIGNKLLSEPMLTRFTGTYVQHLGEMSYFGPSSLVQVTASHLFDGKPQYGPMLPYCKLDP